ncbi:MAG: ABC transporter ATP-binding protein [Acidimicrobiales bacterium]
MNDAIEIDHVSKRFRLYKEKYTSLKERILHAGKIPYEEFWALRDVEFSVQPGETLGILGRNGSGKSTLLKCIAGILTPTDGRILVRGQLAAMLELGAGFQPEMSGRDNIYLNASLLGLSKKEIEKRFDAIVAFAELEEFIDNQVRFYSSGMYVRLGFAVAVNVSPDILLVDEVLAVGDERFQQKCMVRIHQFQEEGRTIVVVSHAPDVMRQICNRVAVIDGGQLVTVAPPGEAIRAFRDKLISTGAEGPLPAEEVSEPPAPLRDGAGVCAPVLATPPGSRRVRITSCRVERPGANERPHLLPGEPLTIVLDVEARDRVAKVAFGCTIFADNGALVFDCDSEMLGEAYDLPPGLSSVQLEFSQMLLFDGRYAINVRVQDIAGGTVHARLEPATTLEVVNPGRATGLVALPFAVKVSVPDLSPTSL